MAVAMSAKAQAARDKFLEGMTKSYGKGSVVSAADVKRPIPITTGSLSLDAAMSSGGFMLGRITELWGPPSGGKTSLCLVAAAEAQKTYPDKLVGFIDVEGTFDQDWAEQLGVDKDRMDVFSPPTAESVADFMKEMLQSEQYSLIILDSVGAMLPKEEFEKDAEQVSVGTIAKIITRMVKIAAVYAKRYGVAVAIINQVRANLGFGQDTDTGGGWALKHVTSHKLQVKRGSAPYTVGNGENKVNVGYKMAVKVQKNKFGPEGRNVQFDFITQATEKYGPVGINQAQDACAVGIRLGVIKQAGMSYTLPNGAVIKSRATLEETLANDPSLVLEVRTGVLNAIKDEFHDDDLALPTLEEIESE